MNASYVSRVPSPSYVVHSELLRKNLEVLEFVQNQTDCKIILALKGFAMFSTFPIIREYLAGTTASSLNEACLAAYEFGKEVHVYAPAYSDADFVKIMPLAHHITFNSFSQWHRFKDQLHSYNNNPNHTKKIAAGLRINPEHSEVKVDLYNPCAPYSRLGVTLDHFKNQNLDGISGLHFHTLCGLNSDALERTLDVVAQKFDSHLKNMSWVNFGGGHHITRPDYDVKRLCRLISEFKSRYHLDVYLEPGEAVALNTGVLVASVLDIIHNGMPIAILDTSATDHMPDVLEMPYRPQIIGGDLPQKKAHTYRLGGMTCLAGDVIGDYSFDKPLAVGDRLVFLDMAHYTMVKTTQFNGINLPAMVIYDETSDHVNVVREFGYSDYRNLLS